MLFGKKGDLISVKYQVKIGPNNFEVKKKKVTKEKLEELQNDSNVRIIEMN